MKNECSFNFNWITSAWFIIKIMVLCLFCKDSVFCVMIYVFLFSASWQARCFKLPFLPIQGHVLNLINIGGLKEKKSTLNKIVTKYQNQRHQCSNLIFIQIKRDFDIFFVNIKSNKNELPAHYTVVGN